MVFSKRDLELTSTVGQGVVYISRLFWQSTITVIVVSGESGLVYKGYLNTALGKELVAVKTGKGYYALAHKEYVSCVCVFAALFSSGDMERLAKEVATMLSFEHPNVMSLVGVCIEEEIPLLIMPFMSNGCVLEFVKHHRDELLCINATAPQVESSF